MTTDRVATTYYLACRVTIHCEPPVWSVENRSVGLRLVHGYPTLREARAALKRCGKSAWKYRIFTKAQLAAAFEGERAQGLTYFTDLAALSSLDNYAGERTRKAVADYSDPQYVARRMARLVPA